LEEAKRNEGRKVETHRARTSNKNDTMTKSLLYEIVTSFHLEVGLQLSSAANIASSTVERSACKTKQK
jgi:hypothetical protein